MRPLHLEQHHRLLHHKLQQHLVEAFLVVVKLQMSLVLHNNHHYLDNQLQHLSQLQLVNHNKLPVLVLIFPVQLIHSAAALISHNSNKRRQVNLHRDSHLVQLHNLPHSILPVQHNNNYNQVPLLNQHCHRYFHRRQINPHCLAVKQRSTHQVPHHHHFYQVDYLVQKQLLRLLQVVFQILEHLWDRILALQLQVNLNNHQFLDNQQAQVL